MLSARRSDRSPADRPATPSWRRAITRGRLLLAAKTALAAGLAWQLAPILPFADDEYSYYAPLGVLVSMYPTVARSWRSGLQLLAGLLLGIAVGTVGVASTAASVPAAVAVALVAGIGMLFAGLPVLGPGQSWVPIAGLFVLLLGGGSLEEYSVSYVENVAFGVLVGLVVNLLVFPPLYLEQAARRLTGLREAVAQRMRRMADALSGAAVGADVLASEAADLLGIVAAVRDEVREADESRRSNFRGRSRRGAGELNLRRLHALDRTTQLVQMIADGLGRLRSGESARREAAEALRAVADLVDAPPGADDSGDRMVRADSALQALLAALDRAGHGQASEVAVDLMVADALRRIIDVSRPFVQDAGTPEP